MASRRGIASLRSFRGMPPEIGHGRRDLIRGTLEGNEAGQPCKQDIATQKWHGKDLLLRADLEA